jgi:hypothetical protein
MPAADADTLDEQPKSRETYQLAASDEWRDWLKRLSEHCHETRPISISRALKLYADHVGFLEPQPHR